MAVVMQKNASYFVRGLVKGAAGATILLWAAIDVWGVSRNGLTFLGFGQLVAWLLLIGAVGYFYARNNREMRLADMAYFGALWISMTACGAVATYLVASLRLPLYDAQFVGIDSWFGFNWLEHAAFIKSYPLFSTILLLAYGSAMMQIILLVIFFAHTKNEVMNHELWWTAAIALILTTIVSGIFPALGAFSYFNTDLEKAIHLSHLQALRDGTNMVFSLGQMQGIVTLPSYHTVLAILLIYVCRSIRYLFPFSVVLNGLMLIATPYYGGHYLIDMVAGAIVAGVTIAAVRVVKAKRERSVQTI